VGYEIIDRYRCDCGRNFAAADAEERHEFLPEEFWIGATDTYLVCPYCASDDLEPEIAS
jgi:DNA-directed RNA polymerase subunit RPC12/RpoP